MLRSEQVKWPLELNWTRDACFTLVITWTFLMLVSPETRFHFRFIWWNENVPTSLFDSHVEVMIRKLNLVCLVLIKILHVNNAEAKTTNSSSYPPPLRSAMPTHKICFLFLHISISFDFPKQSCSNKKMYVNIFKFSVIVSYLYNTHTKYDTSVTLIKFKADLNL